MARICAFIRSYQDCISKSYLSLLQYGSSLDWTVCYVWQSSPKIFKRLYTSCRQWCWFFLTIHQTQYNYLYMKGHLCHFHEYLWSFAIRNRFLGPRLLFIYPVLHSGKFSYFWRIYLQLHRALIELTEVWWHCFGLLFQVIVLNLMDSQCQIAQVCSQMRLSTSVMKGWILKHSYDGLMCMSATWYPEC